MDVFIHENFFNGPEQVAIVYDPIRHEEGIFVWREGEARLEMAVVEPNVEQQDDKMTVKITSLPEAIAGAGDVEPVTRLHRLEYQQRWLWIALLFTAVLAVAWPVILDFWLRPKLPPPPIVAPSSIHNPPNNDQKVPTQMHGSMPPLTPDSHTESQTKIPEQPSDASPIIDPSKNKP